MTLVPQTRRHMYEQIYEDLKARIDNGQLVPESLLPHEKELAAEYGVSRITTNRALQMLASDGYITRIPGKGSMVLDASARKADDNRGQLAEAITPTPDRLIGLIVPILGQSYEAGIVAGIEAAIEELGAFLVIRITYRDQSREETAIRQLTQLGVKGLMIYPINGAFYNPELLRLHLEGFPIVLLDRELRKIPVPTVTSNNRESAYLLTRHLVDLGHKSIAFLSSPVRDTATLEDRLDGYIQALSEAGLHAEQHLQRFSLSSFVDRNPESIENNETIIREFLVNSPEVTAVVCTEYHLACDALRVTQALGMQVPEHLSLACFDGPEISDDNHYHWTFTHIHQDESSMGRLAVKTLWNRIQGLTETPTSAVVPARLVVGNSTGPMQNDNRRNSR